MKVRAAEGGQGRRGGLPEEDPAAEAGPDHGAAGQAGRTQGGKNAGEQGSVARRFFFLGGGGGAVRIKSRVLKK